MLGMSTKDSTDEERLELLELAIHETRVCLAALITLFSSRDGALTGMSDEQFAERMERLREFVMDVDKQQRAFLAQTD
jgi:hypothetical protein